MQKPLRFRRFLIKVGLVALSLALMFALLIVYLDSEVYKRTHSEVLLVSTSRKFQLVVPDCETKAPELWIMSDGDRGVWQKVDGIELTLFYNCVAMPAKLYASKNEKLLFVRRSVERELATGLAPGASVATWSDLIDLTASSPKVVLSLGGCCEQETEEAEKSIDAQIDRIAKENGVELQPWR
jgi:hypothetical protein